MTPSTTTLLVQAAAAFGAYRRQKQTTSLLLHQYAALFDRLTSRLQEGSTAYDAAALHEAVVATLAQFTAAEQSVAKALTQGIEDLQSLLASDR